jgi:CRISPR-associated endonuclease Cas2
MNQLYLSYDVNCKRDKKVFKLCHQYLYARNESFFSGKLTERKEKKMIKELSALIKDEDSVFIISYDGTIKETILGKGKAIASVI